MSTHPRYLCIHGHFYQPPRENPWLDRVEEQPSAAPFHDWNERVSAECYGPNALARILDDQNLIQAVTNNYEHISFNFGPTLLSWLDREMQGVYEAIIKADRTSVARRQGHGNAVAQVYNHIIMPLASRHDKQTQVRWGIDDFRFRFGRRPTGMWLAETAVDSETLEVLVDNGIRYTILAPHQAEAARPLGSESEWIEFPGAEIDPTRPYLCRLPSGREIVLFFYDGPISRSIAFDGLLKNGATFLERIRQGFSSSRDWPQILSIGVDGETFGHHSRFGEMALAWVLDRLKDDPNIKVTNYAEFLEMHPPTWEARLRERTSWSCAHGVERWRSDCGCTTGGRDGWDQSWRRPLRDALDWLKKQLDDIVSDCGLFTDVWRARDDYLQLLQYDTPVRRTEFLDKHFEGERTTERETLAWQALEMQRNGLLMYTSCAWFFEEVSRIEARQVLSYAARAIQLAHAFKRSLEPRFLRMLEMARSNLSEYRNAAVVYERHVRPLVVDLDRAVAHSAIVNLALAKGAPRPIDCCSLSIEESLLEHSGEMTLSLGWVRSKSRATLAERAIMYCAIHFGGHDFRCSVIPMDVLRDYENLRDQVLDHFRRQSVTELIRALDAEFGRRYYTLRDLFQEERKSVLYHVSDATLRDTEQTYRKLYEENRQLMAFAQEIHVPVLRSFRYASAFVLSVDVRRAVEAPLSDAFFRDLERLASEVRNWDAKLDTTILGWRVKARLEEAMDQLALTPTDAGRVRVVTRLLEVAEQFGLHPDLWQVQNQYHGIFLQIEADKKARRPLPRAFPADARRQLYDLGTRLGFRPELRIS